MYNITLIPGDGIGPEVISATKKVIDATGVNIKWDIIDAGEGVIKRHGTPLPDSVINSIKLNKVALKGPISTPIGGGFRSVNVTLRKELDLYANVRPAKSYQGIKSKYNNVDIIICRENTEDLYAGIERMIDEETAETVKIITKKASERIVNYAFQYARKEKRKKVTVIHKANIMKFTDGLFLNVARNIAKEFQDIEFEEIIVDAVCMKLVQEPENYDVLVAPNLYGDIISDLCAGLVGGLGVTPGANIGQDIAVFEPVHGSALNLAGRNIANPIATILSGVLMLRHIGENIIADKIENTVSNIIKDGKLLTQDLGGELGTLEFADTVIANLG